MAGHTILLNLIGGVALLIWGSHMVQAAILKGFGDRIRGVISRAAGRPLRAAATGVAAATALQSATATAVLVTAFVTRGLLALPAALALMLGADLGTTLVVQALSVNLGAAVPLLLLAGVVLARMAGRPKTAQVGRMLIGFGLILLALSLIAAASEPMRGSEVTALVLERLGHDPLLALIVAALLTWVMHSSVAFVLFVISLSGAGLVGLPLALTLVLGANVGGGLIALGLAPNAPVAARRVLYGNLAFRAAGALVRSWRSGRSPGSMERLGGDAGRLAADFHTLFNLALVLVFLPLVAAPRGCSNGSSPSRSRGARRRGSTISTRRSSTSRRWR